MLNKSALMLEVNSEAVTNNKICQNLMSINPTIYIVDDVQEQLDLISEMLEQSSYEVKAFPSGDTFLQESELNETGCILLDNHMPGVSGLEVQRELKQRDCELPIMFMSGGSLYGDVVVAVQEGALGFLQKPFTRYELMHAVKDAVKESIQRLADSHSKSSLDSLTPRERQVYNLVVSGHINKVISVELGISLGTVEFHRANLMKKLGVSTLADLIALSQN